jgi:hypothetical protein
VTVASGKIPMIAGSFTNWEEKEMVPLIPFCEQIDPNKPNPITLLKK